jgi:hypothetical protein
MPPIRKVNVTPCPPHLHRYLLFEGSILNRRPSTHAGEQLIFEISENFATAVAMPAKATKPHFL